MINKSRNRTGAGGTSAPRRFVHRATARIAAILVMVAGLAVVTAAPAHAAVSDKRNDYNRDGISDMVAINRSDYCLYRWYGTGAGGFGAGVRVGCGWQDHWTSLSAVGDLNRDGNGDLVAIGVGTSGYCLFRWLGDGNGGFGTKIQLGCGWEPYTFNLNGFDYGAIYSAGDLNNDGAGDLLAVNKNNNCMWRWYGNGAGGFGAGAQLGCGWDPYRFSITGAGDLNRDGNADIVAIDQDHLWRWYGTGTGSFGSGVQVGGGWFPYYSIRTIAGMGDLNRDGIGDIVAINLNDKTLHGWYGAGNGGFTGGGIIGPGWGPYYLAQ